MSSPPARKDKVGKASDADSERRRREDHSIKLRKEKKEDKLNKQRKVSFALCGRHCCLGRLPYCLQPSLPPPPSSCV